VALGSRDGGDFEVPLVFLNEGIRTILESGTIALCGLQNAPIRSPRSMSGRINVPALALARSIMRALPRPGAAADITKRFKFTLVSDSFGLSFAATN